MDVRRLTFTVNGDERGALTALEVERDVPFPIQRVFLVHDVAPGVPRGGHAHRDTDQVVLGLAGTVEVRVSDGTDEAVHLLSGPGEGLYVGRMTWIDLARFDPGAICLVLASDRYDRARSLRTWDDYLAAVADTDESR